MKAAVAVSVTYGFSCAFCGAQYRQGFLVGGNEDLPEPALPKGWHQIDHAVFCPVHVVEIKKSGQLS